MESSADEWGVHACKHVYICVKLSCLVGIQHFIVCCHFSFSTELSTNAVTPLLVHSRQADQVMYSLELDSPNSDFIFIEPHAHHNDDLKNAMDSVTFSLVQPQISKTVWVSTLGIETDSWSNMLHQHISMCPWAEGHWKKARSSRSKIPCLNRPTIGFTSKSHG